MKVSRKGKDLADLLITQLEEEEYNLPKRGKRHAAKPANSDVLSDSYLMPRRRRSSERDEKGNETAFRLLVFQTFSP